MVRLSHVICSTLIATTAVAQDFPVPKSMGALGDSITAGALANYRRTDIHYYPWLEGWIAGQLLSILVTRNFKPIERKDYSWATGLNSRRPVSSHADRILKINGGEKIKVYNAAVSGNIAADIRNKQLDKMMDWSEKHLDGQLAPDYITMLIGANDICGKDIREMTPVNEYINDIAYTVDTILSKSPNSRILISALPNIESLRGVAKDAPLTGRPVMNKCQDLWNLAKLCPTLTTLSDPEKRAQVAERVRDYNNALSDLVQKRAADYGDRIRFAYRPYEIKFSKTDISVDCFHPNPDGQNKIAETTWNTSWWAGVPATR